MPTDYSQFSYDKPKPQTPGAAGVLETGEDFTRALLDKLSFGIGPAFANMFTGGAATAGLERGKERSPTATTLGRATGGALQDVATGAGLAKAGIATGTSLAQHMLSGGLSAGLNESGQQLGDVALKGAKPNLGRPFGAALTGAIGGSLGKGITALRDINLQSYLPRLPKGAALPTRSGPQAGLPGGVPITGPEAMATGLGGKELQAAAPRAQGMLQQGAAPPGLLEGRGQVIDAARGPLVQTADDAAVLAQRAAPIELPTRMRGGSNRLPDVEAARAAVAARQSADLPGAPQAPRDSVATNLQALDDLRRKLPLMAPEARAAAEAQIARAEGRITKAAPQTMAARGAAADVTGFDSWRKGLTPEALPALPKGDPNKTLMQDLLMGALSGGAGFGASGSPLGLLAGAAPTIGRIGAAKAGEVIAGRNASILADPARTTAALSDPTSWLLEMFKRQGLGALLGEGVRETQRSMLER